MRLLVCGGRNFDDYELLEAELSNIGVDDIDVIMHGGAKGADKLAGKFARHHRIPEIVFEADWELHGKAAGPIRNQEMLDEGEPDLVVAFPGGKGTADMVRKARKAGIEIKIIED